MDYEFPHWSGGVPTRTLGPGRWIMSVPTRTLGPREVDYECANKDVGPQRSGLWVCQQGRWAPTRWIMSSHIGWERTKHYKGVEGGLWVCQQGCWAPTRWIWVPTLVERERNIIRVWKPLPNGGVFRLGRLESLKCLVLLRENKMATNII